MQQPSDFSDLHCDGKRKFKAPGSAIPNRSSTWRDHRDGIVLPHRRGPATFFTHNGINLRNGQGSNK